MYVTEKIVRWLNWRYDGKILIYECAAFEWVKSKQTGIFFVRLEVEKHSFLKIESLRINTNTTLTDYNIEEVIKTYFGVKNCYTRDCDRMEFAAYVNAIEKNVLLKSIKNVATRIQHI
jgi:hypothetical protein